MEKENWIYYIEKNILDHDTKLHAIIHQCNCHHVMGAGVAKAIKDKYPQVFEEDKKTFKGDMSKLGSFSYCDINNVCRVYNMYSQYGFSNSKIETAYWAFDKAIHNVCVDILTRNLNTKIKIGIPFLIGCGLAGGDHRVILNSIVNRFKPYYKKVNLIFYDIVKQNPDYTKYLKSYIDSQ